MKFVSPLNRPLKLIFSRQKINSNMVLLNGVTPKKKHFSNFIFEQVQVQTKHENKLGTVQKVWFNHKQVIVNHALDLALPFCLFAYFQNRKWNHRTWIRCCQTIRTRNELTSDVIQKNKLCNLKQQDRVESFPSFWWKMSLAEHWSEQWQCWRQRIYSFVLGNNLKHDFRFMRAAGWFRISLQFLSHF